MQFAYVPLGQAERDVNSGAGIDGAAVRRLRGFETNAECRPFGRLVQAMTKSAHDAQHMDVASGGEFEIKRYGAFYAGAARFIRVLRRRLSVHVQNPCFSALFERSAGAASAAFWPIMALASPGHACIKASQVTGAAAMGMESGEDIYCRAHVINRDNAPLSNRR